MTRENDTIDIAYPPELPITAFRQEILDALEKNSVVIVCGETGSGKTTQLPKMAMESGRGRKGKKIACTQPRRVAATAVAERVAKELGSPVGETIGFQHRFERKLSKKTRVKFMTDGVLLAETLGDPLLEAYDTIIIDEAHERSLNIDFLLGILKRILEKRSDLKLIISSATLDTERFSRFFGDAPGVIVPGRLFPVETRYMPCDDEDKRDLPRDVARAARALPADDDILVFLPGERDIRETADHLGRDVYLGKSEIIPLYASLPPGEIARAFKPLQKRRIVLATNVAETSLTIPGIKAVIDPGLARISRYNHRTRVQRLQIERISRASAQQRAGRCGRIAPGICIRLYSEDDFASRDEYTPPEILRSSLAGVILTMTELKLGSIDTFPFIDPPGQSMIREGLRELIELDAIERDDRTKALRLTKTGRRLAKIPLEPRLARMLVEASDLGTLPRVLPVVAAMSCDNPKRRPLEEKEKADLCHAKWKVKGSDFLATKKLWDWWLKETSSLSATQARKLAAASYLSYPKMREWKELALRLNSLCASLALDTESDNDSPDLFHRALLPSLLGNIGKFDRERHDFKGALGMRFLIHPSSVLAPDFKPPKKKAPPRGAGKPQKTPKETDVWVMAGNLTETTRLYARDAAKIELSWIEPAAGALARRSYHDPEWDEKSGFVRAKERVTLHGLLLVDGRRRDFTRIDPVLSRKLFILHALVLGEFRDMPPLVRKNRAVLDGLEELSRKLRRPEIFDIDKISRHFDSVVPGSVASVHEFRKWLHSASPGEKRAFTLDRDEWFGNAAASSEDFPEEIKVAGAVFTLEYANTPDDPDRDGITCTAKKSDAPALPLWRSDYLVPGALPEKVSVILSSLPSSVKRALPGISETLSLILPMIRSSDEPLLCAIRSAVQNRLGIRIGRETLDAVKIPSHLAVRFRITDDMTGKELSSSRNLAEALEKSGATQRKDTARKTPLKHVSWDFGKVSPLECESGQGTRLFKALLDEKDGVSLRYFRTRDEALRAHSRAVARLIALHGGKSFKNVFNPKHLTFGSRLFLKSLGYDEARIEDDILMKAVREAAVERREEVTDRNTFLDRVAQSREIIRESLRSLVSLVSTVFDCAASCSDEIERAALPEDISGDMTDQISWLVFPGFVASTPYEELSYYPKYFKALKTRIERAKADKTRDRAKMARFMPYWKQYRDAATGKTAVIASRKAFSEYRWLLEEYRISLFAQETRTNRRVSPEILARTWLEATS